MNILKSVLGKVRSEAVTVAENLLAKSELSKLEQIRLTTALVTIVKSHPQKNVSEIQYFN